MDKYYRASSPDMGLNSMLGDTEQTEQGGIGIQEYTEFEEQFPGVIWMALGLLVLEFIILERKNKWLRNFKLFEN